jgi:hypothetical protein
MDNMNPISRFINEIGADYIDKGEIDNNKETNSYSKSSIDETAEYKCGEKVLHNEFGEGVVISVDKSILTIAFPHPYGI